MNLSRMKAAGICWVAGAVLLAAGGLAWACTPEQYISTIRPLSGPAGSQVTIAGKGALPGSPVQIRWDGLQGAKIAETVAGADGSFSVQARIPAASPEVYSIISSAPATGIGRSVFEVTSEPLANPGGDVPGADPGLRSISSDLWEGIEGQPLMDATAAGEPSSSAHRARTAGIGLAAVGLAASLGALAALSGNRTRATTSQDPRAGR